MWGKFLCWLGIHKWYHGGVNKWCTRIHCEEERQYTNGWSWWDHWED